MTSSASRWRCRATRWWSGRARGQQRHGGERQPGRQQRFGQSGAAYVFVRSGGVWSQQAYLKASNTGAGDCFGESVAVSGDTVVVGASCEDSNATGVNGNQADNSAADTGAAYVFVRTGTSLEPAGLSQGLQHRRPVTSSASRCRVCGRHGGGRGAREDSNATGVNGNQADNSAAGQWRGLCLRAQRAGSGASRPISRPPTPEAGDFFGWSVAVSGDTVVVGAVQRTATPRGSTATRRTTALRTVGRSMSSSDSKEW